MSDKADATPTDSPVPSPVLSRHTPASSPVVEGFSGSGTETGTENDTGIAPASIPVPGTEAGTASASVSAPASAPASANVELERDEVVEVKDAASDENNAGSQIVEDGKAQTGTFIAGQAVHPAETLIKIKDDSQPSKPQGVHLAAENTTPKDHFIEVSIEDKTGDLTAGKVESQAGAQTASQKDDPAETLIETKEHYQPIKPQVVHLAAENTAPKENAVEGPIDSKYDHEHKDEIAKVTQDLTANADEVSPAAPAGTPEGASADNPAEIKDKETSSAAVAEEKKVTFAEDHVEIKYTEVSSGPLTKGSMNASADHAVGINDQDDAKEVPGVQAETKAESEPEKERSQAAMDIDVSDVEEHGVQLAAKDEARVEKKLDQPDQKADLTEGHPETETDPDIQDETPDETEADSEAQSSSQTVTHDETGPEQDEKHPQHSTLKRALNDDQDENGCSTPIKKQRTQISRSLSTLVERVVESNRASVALKSSVNRWLEGSEWQIREGLEEMNEAVSGIVYLMGVVSGCDETYTADDLPDVENAMYEYRSCEHSVKGALNDIREALYAVDDDYEEEVDLTRDVVRVLLAKEIRDRDEIEEVLNEILKRHDLIQTRCWLVLIFFS